jgi:LysR family hydrogen peroxide-inducible transcriptional activator
MLYEYRTEPMLERLHNGDIDVGILALPLQDETLMTRELYAEPFVLALPDTHRLAGRAQVKTDDLNDETLLLLEDGHCLRDQALAVCARSGVREKQDFLATSIETLRQMVAAGVGITLLPTLASRGAYGSARGMSTLPFAKPVPSRLIGAVWRKSSARTAAIGAVCDQIARHSGLA